MLVLPNKTSLVWDRFLKNNKILVYKYIVRQIKKGIDQDSSGIELFRSEDNTLNAWIPQNHVLKFLEAALNVFVVAEEYEYASKTKKVMSMCHVNNLIKESKPEG